MRIGVFDSLRGFAMVLMAVYHFCFDLNYVGVLHENMNSDPFWLWFRVVIMTLFMGLVGVGLSLSRADFGSLSYRQRLIQIAACALVISLATVVAIPESWIFFGVLHLAVVSALLGPWLTRRPFWSLAGGIFLVALPEFWRNFYFQKSGWVISGLAPMKPITEDFAPLCPWLGVVMIGVFLGWAVLKTTASTNDEARKTASSWQNWEWGPLSRLGRHSLMFYMVHQAVLFPLAWIVSQISR